MSPISDTVPEPAFQPKPDAPATLPQARLFYWSVRRELWENRSIYIAPLAVAGVILFGVVLGALHFSGHVQHLQTDPAQPEAIRIPFEIAAAVLVIVSVLTAAFYCLGALHGERRDRSILFWKSLPVSDLVAVLAKAAIPLLVAPVVAFAVVVVTQLVMLLLGTAFLLGHGQGVGVLWSQLPILSRAAVLAYGLIANTLWQAPVYGWLLLVSAWARRAPFLWAVLPPLALCIVEKIAFDSSVVSGLLSDRLTGAFTEAFDPVSHATGIDLAQCDPARFVSNPGLWIGLGLTAALLAAAVWQRRRREPI